MTQELCKCGHMKRYHSVLRDKVLACRGSFCNCSGFEERSMNKQQATHLFTFDKLLEEIELKIQLDWQGQNEFIDWLRNKSKEVQLLINSN